MSSSKSFKKGGKKWKSSSKKKQMKSSVAHAVSAPLPDEAKYVDVGAGTTSYACNVNGLVTHVSAVAQGSTVNQRVGRKYQPTAFHLRGQLVAGSTCITNISCIYLVWDEQPNKALAAISDILQVGIGGAGSSDMCSLPVMENVQRFKILRKWRYKMCSSSAGTNQDSAVIYDIDEYVKLPRDCVCVPTTADTTGAIGNTITGALLLVTCGSAAAGTAAGLLTANYRLHFRDL